MKIYRMLATLLVGLTAVLTATAQAPATACNTARHDSCQAPHTSGKAYHNGGAVLLPATRKTNVLLAGVGYTNILDTYLSPEKYRGIDVRIMSHTRREKDSSQWVNQFVHEGNIAFANNRASNGNEMAGAYTFRYSLMHRWSMRLWQHPLHIMAGGSVAANLGFVYNTRNSNNPANARVSINIEPTVAADYYLGRASLSGAFKPIGSAEAGFPLVLHYEASAPLLGVMFSPNYGQSYYEIFTRGNYDHNIVPTTIAATPSFRQMLTLDLNIGRTKWRVGYLGIIDQSQVNNLKTHVYTHAFMVGVVKTFRTLKQ